MSPMTLVMLERSDTSDEVCGTENLRWYSKYNVAMQHVVRNAI